jgi:hypothetical protein
LSFLFGDPKVCEFKHKFWHFLESNFRCNKLCFEPRALLPLILLSKLCQLNQAFEAYKQIWKLFCLCWICCHLLNRRDLYYSSLNRKNHEHKIFDIFRVKFAKSLLRQTKIKYGKTVFKMQHWNQIFSRVFGFNLLRNKCNNLSLKNAKT